MDGQSDLGGLAARESSRDTTPEIRRVMYVKHLERRVDTLESSLNQAWAMLQSLEAMMTRKG